MNKTPIKRLGPWIVVLLPALLFSGPASGYEEIAVAGGGAIRGAVQLKGQPPSLPSMPITKFKEFCRNAPNESLILGPGRGVRNAVVTLEDIKKGKALEAEAVHELDNARCRFVPHVQAAGVGQFVVIKNTDSILHTAHAVFGGSQPQFNAGLYPGKAVRKPLASPGLVKIGCELHPWMSAYIMVTDHPYHAVTDAYGQFELGEVPPGAYRLKVWHETLGTKEQAVEVKSGAVSKLDLLFSSSKGAAK